MPKMGRLAGQNGRSRGYHLTNETTTTSSISGANQSNSSSNAAAGSSSRCNMDAGDNIDNTNSASLSASVTNNTTIPFSPPYWLLSGEKSNKAAKPMNYPMPAVPPATRQAIANFIQRQRPPTASHPHQQQLQQLQSKLADQKSRVKTAQQKMERFLQAKEEGLQEIRSVREEQIMDAMEKIERKITRQREKTKQEREEEWKRETEREMKALQEQFDREQKEQEDEFEKERLQHQRQAEKVFHEPADKDEAGPSNGAKRTESSAKNVGEEDPDSESNAGKDKTEDKSSVQPRRSLREVPGKKEFDALKQQVDSLTEKKSELVWLLKQVIRAERETKRKMAENVSSKKKMKH